MVDTPENMGYYIMRVVLFQFSLLGGYYVKLFKLVFRNLGGKKARQTCIDVLSSWKDNI